MVKCFSDGTEHESIEALHAHLRRFKIKQSDYYTTYCPRRCLATGKPIPFKDAAQYLSQDFVDKNAIKRYIKERPTEAREWAVSWLKRRKEEKGLVYAPSQAELRSLQCPSMKYYDAVGGYYEITRELGFNDRYERVESLSPELDVSRLSVVCDTREQLPLKLPNIVRAKIDAGDYGLEAEYDRGVYVERKALGDMVSTLSHRKIVRKRGDDSSFERFDRELTRAAEKDHYLVMLVESSINDALAFDYLPQMRWTKASPAYIWHNLRELLNRYPLNFQVLFADGRIDATQKVLRILGLGDRARKVDLQYAAERGLI